MSSSIATDDLLLASSKLALIPGVNGTGRSTGFLPRLALLILVRYMLRQAVSLLTNDMLVNMSKGEAAFIYRALTEAEEPMRQFYESVENQSRIVRFCFGWFLGPIVRDIERLLDVLEAVAWAADGELAGQIDALLAQP